RPANRPVRRPAPTTLLAPVNQLVQPAALNAVTATAVQGEAAHAPAPLPRSGPARQSALAARAATEYVYVGQDLRHIAVLASAIGAVLVVLWVLIDVLRLIQL
ncbi:MAG TPA: hypothetical protein VN771_01815, partial [Candidatus Baltobacteraceae bacterium]|nr:hypothetical protein [Candidatus Baltobacteraceae bacterium]